MLEAIYRFLSSDAGRNFLSSIAATFAIIGFVYQFYRRLTSRRWRVRSTQAGTKTHETSNRAERPPASKQDLPEHIQPSLAAQEGLDTREVVLLIVIPVALLASMWLWIIPLVGLAVERLTELITTTMALDELAKNRLRLFVLLNTITLALWLVWTIVTDRRRRLLAVFVMAFGVPWLYQLMLSWLFPPIPAPQATEEYKDLVAGVVTISLLAVTLVALVRPRRYRAGGYPV